MSFLCSHVLKGFPASEPVAVREHRVNPVLVMFLRLRRAYRIKSYTWNVIFVTVFPTYPTRVWERPSLGRSRTRSR